MNLSRQPVSLTGLSHPFCHIRIFLQLLIRRLQFMIQKIDLFDRVSLGIDYINTVYNKQNDIQRYYNIVYTEQILLCIG